KNFYGNRKGIEVLSPSAVQQLATAIETKKLVNWQKYMVFATAGMVIVTAIATIVNYINSGKMIKRNCRTFIKN
ncbi:MAG: hypothetical protein J7L80_03260, partial [Thermoplasmata archaeon]|nr:hypothetical protein [Thermoplasmata archaeon]